MALSPFGLCCLVWKASQDESFALTLRSHGAPGIRERGSPCGSPWDPGAWQPVCGVVGGELWVLCAFRAGLGPQGTPGPRAALLGVSPCAQPRPSAPRSPTPGTAKRGWARLPVDAGRRDCDIQGVQSQGTRLSWFPSERAWVMTQESISGRWEIVFDASTLAQE